MPTDHAELRRLAVDVAADPDYRLHDYESIDCQCPFCRLSRLIEDGGLLALLDEIEALRRECDEWRTRYRQRLRDLE